MQLVKAMPRSLISCAPKKVILSIGKTSMARPQFTTQLEKVTFVRHSNLSTSGQALTTLTPRIKGQSFTPSTEIAMKWWSFWLTKELTCRWRTKKVLRRPSMPRNKTNLRLWISFSRTEQRLLPIHADPKTIAGPSLSLRNPNPSLPRTNGRSQSVTCWPSCVMMASIRPWPT